MAVDFTQASNISLGEVLKIISPYVKIAISIKDTNGFASPEINSITLFKGEVSEARHSYHLEDMMNYKVISISYLYLQLFNFIRISKTMHICIDKNVRYGTEKTGKKEFLEELMKQIPEGQEIKLATFEEKNEDVKNDIIQKEISKRQ